MHMGTVRPVMYILVGMGVLALGGVVVFFPELFALLARVIRAFSSTEDLAVKDMRRMGPDAATSDRARFLHPRGMYWRSRGR